MLIKLFVTAGCHLCDLALLEIHAVKSAQTFTVEQIEIGDDDQLIEQFGVRIPVLQLPDGNELNWPFDSHAVAQFITAHSAEL